VGLPYTLDMMIEGSTFEYTYISHMYIYISKETYIYISKGTYNMYRTSTEFPGGGLLEAHYRATQCSGAIDPFLIYRSSTEFPGGGLFKLNQAFTHVEIERVPFRGPFPRVERAIFSPQANRHLVLFPPPPAPPFFSYPCTLLIFGIFSPVFLCTLLLAPLHLQASFTLPFSFFPLKKKTGLGRDK